MADLTGNLGGQQIDARIPDFALESTAQEMVTALNKMAGIEKKEFKDRKKLAEEELKLIDELLKGDEKNSKALEEALEKLAKQVKEGGLELDPKQLEQLNREQANAEATLRKTYGYMKTFGLGVIGATSALALGFFNAVTSAGETLNELTKAGVGFGDAQGSSIDALSQLSAVGIDAVEFLSNFSRAGAVLGVNTLSNFSKTFDELNKSGIDLGMTLEESAERFGEELDVRAQLGILNAGMERQVQMETMRTMKTTQLFSQALGISTDELRSFASSLVTNTNILSGSLLRFSNETQSSMVAGIKEFGIVMKGLGGEGGEAIAEAMTEAAAGGALGFSQNLVGFTAVLPRLQQTTVQLSNAMQNGTLTQEMARDVAMEFGQELGNLSEGEKQRIFAMERAGVEGATQMANAVRAFTASAARMEDLNIDPSNVQKGTNALNAAISKVIGLFEALKFSFLEGVGSVGGFGDSLDYLYEVVLKSLNEAFGMSTGSFKEFGKSIGENLPRFIRAFADGLGNLISYLPSMFNTLIGVGKAFLFIGGIIADVTVALTPLLPLIGALAAAFIVAKTVVSAFSMAATMKNAFAGFNPKGFFSNLVGKGGGAGGAGAGVQKQIMDGAGASGKAAGGMKAFGGGFVAMMKAIGTGLKVLGKAAMNPMVWAGLGLLTAALLVMATALRIATPAIEAFGKVILNVMTGVGNIVAKVGEALMHILTGLGNVVLSVFKGIGAVIESVGKAIATVITGIGTAITMVIEALTGLGEMFTNFIGVLGTLDGGQLLYAAAGITAVGAALLAMGAGALVGGIMTGLGKLFGGDTIGNFIKLGEVAPGIVEMSEVMKEFDDVVAKFTDSLENLDGNMVKDQMMIIKDAFVMFGEALDQISFADVFKLAALGIFGGSVAQGQTVDQAGTLPPAPVPATPTTTPVIQTAGKLGDNFKANYSQRDLLAADPELYKEFQQTRRAKEEELMAGGSSRQMAEFRAERDALKEFAPQIAAAGAGTFTDAQGNPIQFDADGNVVAPAGTPPAVDPSMAPTSSDNSADILSALNRQNSLLSQLVRQNQVIADNI